MLLGFRYKEVHVIRKKCLIIINSVGLDDINYQFHFVDTLCRARDMRGAFALSAGSKGANCAKRRK